MVRIERDVFRGGRGKSFCIHGRFDAEITEQRQAERFELLFGVVGQHRSFDQFEEHVGDVRPNAVAVQGVAAALVNDLALRVHDVIVFEQALADAEVVFLDLLLRALDRLGESCCAGSSPSTWPNRSIILDTRSEEKRRIKSSSSDA